MFLEVLFEVGETLVHIRIDPVAVLELADERIRVNVAHVLLAAGHFLEVVDQLEEDADDLLLVVEVEDLRRLLEDLEIEVLKELVARVAFLVMEGKNP